MRQEWDDPTVVPGRETYDDWTDVRGLNLAGDVSFFPHMEDRWTSLVNDRRKELPINQHGADVAIDVCCLTDYDAYTVNGKGQSTTLITEALSLC